MAGITNEGVVVSLSVKLEHQPQYGAEQVNASQCVRKWISALNRPGSVPTRGEGHTRQTGSAEVV